MRTSSSSSPRCPRGTSGRPRDGQEVTSPNQGCPLTHCSSRKDLSTWLAQSTACSGSLRLTRRGSRCVTAVQQDEELASTQITGLAHSAACCGSRTRMLCRSRSERWIISQQLSRAAGSHQCTAQNAGLQHPARATVNDEDLAMVRLRERTVFAPRKDGFCTYLDVSGPSRHGAGSRTEDRVLLSSPVSTQV